MNKKTVKISLPQVEGVELKSATVDIEKGIVVAEYGQEDIEEDISEIVTDGNSARGYLRLDPFKGLFYEKLYTLTQLMTIAKAWNEFDGFKPVWGNTNQRKYHPSFQFINGKLEFSCVGVAQFITNTHVSNFSFKTEKRAEQFGKQFIELFRIVLTN